MLFRSYSMNGNMGTADFLWTPGYRGYQKMSDLTVPGADRTFLFIDEHPGSINDASFAVTMDGFQTNPALARWVDFPGNHHNGAASLSFCDGRVETWKWQDARTTPLFRQGQLIPLNVASPGNPDVARIQAVTTAKR